MCDVANFSLLLVLRAVCRQTRADTCFAINVTIVAGATPLTVLEIGTPASYHLTAWQGYDHRVYLSWRFLPRGETSAHCVEDALAALARQVLLMWTSKTQFHHAQLTLKVFVT